MSKRRLTLQARIPPYQHPRNDWRYAIHTELIKAAKSKAVLYRPDDQLEIVITLYMPENQIRWHDVDNRLKDIMDTLQGRVGGSKLTRGLVPIIPNDHQIYKVTITKKIAPPQSHDLGHIIIKKHTAITSKFLYRTLKPHQFNKKSNMWTPSSVFILRVPESEKRLY
jgi:hypothetical protein